jgi:hypothetical protein
VDDQANRLQRGRVAERVRESGAAVLGRGGRIWQRRKTVAKLSQALLAFRETYNHAH